MSFSSSDVTSSRWGYQTFDGSRVIRSLRGMNGLRSSVRRHDTFDRRHVDERPQADVLARCPNLIALHLFLSAVGATKLVLFDLPRARASLSHFDTDQGTVGRVVPRPVHAIREVPTDNLGPYLFATQVSERLVRPRPYPGRDHCHHPAPPVPRDSSRLSVQR